MSEKIREKIAKERAFAQQKNLDARDDTDNPSHWNNARYWEGYEAGLNYLDDEILSHLKSQGYKSPQELKDEGYYQAVPFTKER